MDTAPFSFLIMSKKRSKNRSFCCFFVLTVGLVQFSIETY